VERESGAVRQLRIGTVATCALVALAALGGASDASAQSKVIAGFVGEGLGADGGVFSQPSEVTVYTAGDADPSNDKLFVVEATGSNNNRVQRLDTHGNFELTWGKDVVQAGAPGDTGSGYEVCTAATTGAASCQGGLPGPRAGEFSIPRGVAVNQSTGHVYVVDRDNFRVQEFDLGGNFVRAWGWGVATGANAFEICTASCRRGISGGGGGQLGEASDPNPFDPGRGKVGIAVDPVNGDVFVADPANGRVQQFSQAGAFIRAFGAIGFESTAVGEFGEHEPLRLAVDSSHVVYVSDSNAGNRIQRYDAQAGAFLAPIACCAPDPGSPLVPGVTVGLEIDPDTDGAGPDEEHLLVARYTGTEDTVVQELDVPTPATGPVTTVVETHRYEVPPSATEIDRLVLGIGINPVTGSLYLVTPNIFAESGGGSFTGCSASACAGLIVLSADSGPLGAVALAVDAESTSASVTATANAGGGVASYRFQLSTDGVNWADSSARGYVSGLDDVAVTGELTGLQPNTPYRVRLVVRKQTGFTTSATEISNDLTFTTETAPPDVETLGTSQRTDTSVRLRGRVDPNGLATTYHFEYGLAGSPLENRIPASGGVSAGSGNTPVVVAQDLAGLAPGTTYEYRIVASNDAGTAEGAIVRFTTEPSPLDAEAPEGRGYELVSPADKVGGVGVGPWYEGPQASALVGVGAHEGERFAAEGYLGSVLVDGPYTYSNDWALAERTASGWVSAPGTSRRAHGPQAKADITMSAAAENLSLTTWGSGGHTLRLFPEMESWDDQVVRNVLFMRKWTTGGWELFGPTDPAQAFSSIDTIGDGPKAVAADGSAVVASGSGTRGLAGPGDPTNFDLVSGDSIYRDETPGEFTDVFPGDDGVRQLVNVCTAGTVLPAPLIDDGELKQDVEPCPIPDEGRDARLISRNGAALSADGNTEGVLSADGSRVFFMSPDPEVAGASCTGPGIDGGCPAQVFVWQRGPDGVVTRWISQTEVTAARDAAANQDAALMAPVVFEGASRDGDKVLFRTIAPLTADDRNGGGAPPAGGVTTGEAQATSADLYMYDMPDGPDGNPATADADPAGGDLVRISAGPDGNGDCNTPVSTLRSLADDGSRVYFTCAAPLAGTPVTGSGTSTSPGGTRSTLDEVNLYLYDANEPEAERWRFIARLPRSTGRMACATVAANSCVNGTRDGSLVTFLTPGALTTDDQDGGLVGDMYAYDAHRDELTRISARPDGATVEDPYPCVPPGTNPRCHGDGGITEDRALPLERLGVAARPRGSDPQGERLAFFQSRSRLVAEDTDSSYDVYQWRALDGELSLLSTGVSDAHDALYVGNDRSGLNVYLATRDRLTWQDRDAVLDVYTARIGGGIPQPPGPPDCDALGGVCQGAGAPPRGTRINSDRPVDEAQARRIRLAILAIRAKARRRAVRTGILRVRVRTSAPAVVRVLARARIRAKLRKVGAASKRVAKPGTVVIGVRLSRPARKRLGSGKALRLRLTVRAGGAAKNARLTLRGASR
jgi:NHL repeat